MIVDLRSNGPQEHHKTLSPSSAPAILQCACFVSSGSGSKDTSKGTDLHNITMNLFCGKEIDNNIDLSDRDDCQWAANETKGVFERELPGSDVRIEEKLKIVTGKVVASYGHADFNGNNDVVGIIVDLKGGLDFKIWNHYYEPQLKIYALALFQKNPSIEKVLCVEVYIKPQKKRSYWVTRLDCEVNFSAIVRRRSNPHKRPCVCDYCGWCGNLLFCPAINKIAYRTAELFSDTLNIIDKLREPENIDCPLIMAQALSVAREVFKPLIERIEQAAVLFSEKHEIPYYERKKSIPRKEVENPLEAFNRIPLSDKEFAKSLKVSLTVLSNQYARKYGTTVKQARFTVENLLDDLIVSNKSEGEDKYRLEGLLFNQTKKRGRR